MIFVIQGALAGLAWPQWVMIQFLYREGEGGLVAEVCHDTIVCILTEVRLGVTTKHVMGYDTAQQRPTTRRRSAATRVATRMTGIESRYNYLYHDWRGRRHSSLRARHGL